MYDTIAPETIPNKITSHTNVLVNALIKKVFTYNVASSGYIFRFASSDFHQRYNFVSNEIFVNSKRLIQPHSPTLSPKKELDK